MDINDVTFASLSDYYVTASCTNESTHDLRKPGKPIHTLSHSPPINKHTIDKGTMTLVGTTNVGIYKLLGVTVLSGIGILIFKKTTLAWASE
jgi:hypothetical protein